MWILTHFCCADFDRLSCLMQIQIGPATIVFVLGLWKLPPTDLRVKSLCAKFFFIVKAKFPHDLHLQPRGHQQQVGVKQEHSEKLGKRSSKTLKMAILAWINLKSSLLKEFMLIIAVFWFIQTFSKRAILEISSEWGFGFLELL